ncbi:hypothetical protein ACH4C6_34920 [Streptomyces sp. NPDC017943]|uniref:hypothetical protein n=1 Tax=Streptomyces sp. NPDC017943 TaxID=3365019 RepID=UPI0037BAD619
MQTLLSSPRLKAEGLALTGGAGIPGLGSGQAVWKVGPDDVDIVQTVLTEEEARLTDTSTRRRKAQHALAADLTTSEEPAPQEQEQDDDPHTEHLPAALEPIVHEGTGVEAGDWDWEMPPNEPFPSSA